MTSASIEAAPGAGAQSRMAMVTGVSGPMDAAIARTVLTESHRVVLADADRAALSGLDINRGLHLD